MELYLNCSLCMLCNAMLRCALLQAEPTFWAQLWRSVRVLGLAFLFMAGKCCARLMHAGAPFFLSSKKWQPLSAASSCCSAIV